MKKPEALIVTAGYEFEGVHQAGEEWSETASLSVRRALCDARFAF